MHMRLVNDKCLANVHIFFNFFYFMTMMMVMMMMDEGR